MPGVGMALQPWLPHLVVLLLLMTSYRIGYREAVLGLRGLGVTLRIALVCIG